MKQEHLEIETLSPVDFPSPPLRLHEHVRKSRLDSRWMYMFFCLFCELICHTPAQIMINALACLPSAFASLIIHCPQSSHPSGTGWPRSRGRAGAAPAHLSPPAGCSKQSSAVSQSMTMRTKGKRCRSDRHFYPPPTLQGSVCQEGLSFSLYPTPSLTPHHTHLVADKAAVLCLPLRLQSEQQNAHHEHCQLQTFFSFISVRPLYIIVHR